MKLQASLSKLVPLAAALMLAVTALSARTVTVTSPDGRWHVAAESAPRLKLDVQGPGGAILSQEIGLKLEGGRELVGGATDPQVRTRSLDETVRPVAPTKFAAIRAKANEATLDFGDYAVDVRAYNDGIAYRFELKLPGEVVIAAEQSHTTFAADPTVWFGEEKDFMSSNEVLYAKQPLSQLKPGALASEPLLVRTSDSGPLALFSETDLQSYPGQWMRVGTDGKSLEAAWPGYPAREEAKSDRSVAVVEREPYIARVHGTRTLPWRFIALAANDGELLTNTLSYVLAEPSRLPDTAWIKPGKVQWDWWHDFNVWDVSFHGGISQQLYLHYIDFAAAHHLQYVLLDEGWYKLGNLLEPANGIDVPALVAHAREKGIRIQLWMTWKTLREQLEPAMAQFERWGVAGLKVDFFDRDDQPMVEFYWKLAAEAAKRHLTLDFHGAHKPAGLLRTYPNVLTVEGVRGAEYNKWSDTVTPEHNLQLPFTRMVAGPMDYTPGAMDNTQPEQFRARNRRPMVMDTRAAELAKYVVFESPLQMLADSPSAYRAAPESLAFLSIVPTTWDETRVLAARVGEYAAVARRSGKQWFIGAMNAGGARELTLDLSFLPAGTSLRVWRDGPNADRDGRDVQCVTTDVTKSVKIELAPNGGWAATTAAK